MAQKINKAEFEPNKFKPKNVVIVLMESFSGRYVGALGNDYNVTPEFDSLSKKGILFSRFFSNGTHTHQGVFATLTSFPNLPNHEYLMQQPEGRNQFSGITKLLPEHNSLFVYNGDFNWDNQLGFFKNQGLQRFVGKHEIKAEQYGNNVWGVPDHLMFDRAEYELLKLSQRGPFIAVVQTLSNHMPYELPQTLEFEPVMIDGKVSERLTAMKYSDWSLGRFFRNIRNAPYYEDTLFVVLGDHGFAVPNQLTSINLLRFHVPLLFLGNFTEDKIGSLITTVASQVDVVPTVVSMLGKTPIHQSWGRNLFDLSQEDEGFAAIKPSGDDPTMAIIKGESILTYDAQLGPNLYQYDLGNKSYSKKLDNPDLAAKLKHELLSYVQTASTSLKNNSTSN
ncbi:MAG: LTA synthase family protein [Pseudomonadales bacterium]|nr:LTA synthase family protein [Pseudomonadales bacterium]